MIKIMNNKIVTEQSPLQTFFLHHLRANNRLFDACLKLNNDQLNYSIAGTYGSIKATLAHIVSAEERYLFSLTGQEIDGPKPYPGMPLTELKLRIQNSSKMLLQVATTF